MSKKVLILVAVIASLLIAIAVVPTLADDFEGNKCYEDWDWCNERSEDEQAYWWKAGWCIAAFEAQVIDELSLKKCLSSIGIEYIASFVNEIDELKESKHKKSAHEESDDEETCVVDCKDDEEEIPAEEADHEGEEDTEEG